MAYNYKPNNYNLYDDSKTFEENVQAGAVFTKEKMDKLEEAVKYASADIEIGEVSVVDDPEKASAVVEFDKAQGTRFIHMAVPKGDKGDKGDQGIQGIQGEKVIREIKVTKVILVFVVPKPLLSIMNL